MHPNNETPKAVSEKTVSDGSALYYSLLYADQMASQRALNTLHFIQTISTTLNDVSEPHVAEKKIHWWHEELARLAKQNARHPSCLAVQEYLHDEHSVKSSLNILSATATERYSAITSDADLTDLVQSDYGARLNLFEQALSTNLSSVRAAGLSNGSKPIRFQTKRSVTENQAEHSSSNKQATIALGLGQFDRLRTLVLRLRCGYAVFSDERYDQHNTSPEELLSSASTQHAISAEVQQNASALIEAAIEEAHRSLEEAVECIAHTRNTDPTSLPVQILCQTRLAQLTLWKKRSLNLLKESVALTPLRKFVIAYRCKRRQSKT